MEMGKEFASLREEMREGFSQMLDIMGKMNERIGGLEVRMGSMEAHMESIDARVSGVERQVQLVNERLDGVEGRLDRVESRLDRVESRLDGVEQKVAKLSVIQETEVLPRLNTIESCYTDTYKRYTNETDKIKQMETDIGILKLVVLNNGKKRVKRKL